MRWRVRPYRSISHRHPLAKRRRRRGVQPGVGGQRRSRPLHMVDLRRRPARRIEPERQRRNQRNAADLGDRKLYRAGDRQQRRLFSATAFSLAIYAQGTPIITTASPLATGTLGAAYSQTFTAGGGATPYTWAIVSGSLPAGLGPKWRGPAERHAGGDGVFGFAVQVTGSDGLFSTTPFVLTVPPPPAIDQRAGRDRDQWGAIHLPDHRHQ